ncbi:MAG: PD-(D/E)XK nuclease family protein, partial [Nanoarchaeota archaeon]
CEKNECSNLKLFDEENLLSVWRNNFKGISWTDKKDNILHGAIDNILINKKNEKLIVLDYKTRGFPLKEDTAEHYQLQLNIYNFLLQQNEYETENFAFLLFYIPKEVTITGEVIFNTDLVKMNVSALEGERAWKKALKLLEGECPEKNDDCEWCKKIEDR